MEEDTEEYLLDEITGKKRKTIMSALNKAKLGKHEMDELFLGEEI